MQLIIFRNQNFYSVVNTFRLDVNRCEYGVQLLKFSVTQVTLF